MEQRESAARQALRKKRARKWAVRTAVFLAAALGAAAAFVILPQMNGEAADNAPQTEKRITTATLGTIEKTVFGLGEVQPASQPGVYARTDGTLAAYTVEVGDSVKAGDIVARLENDELDADIEQLEYDLQTAQQEVRARRRIRSMSIKNSMTRTAIALHGTVGPLLGNFQRNHDRAPADGLIKAFTSKRRRRVGCLSEYGAVMLLSTER
ncbi:MAG: biotin/lipoyl-binding protein [Christensenellales bacterium]